MPPQLGQLRHHSPRDISSPGISTHHKNRAGSVLPAAWGRAGSSSHHFQQPPQGGTIALGLLSSEMLPLRGLPMMFLCLRAHVLSDEGLLGARHTLIAYERGNWVYWM